MVRNIDCKDYQICLSVAAAFDDKLIDCAGCRLEGDETEKMKIDDLDFHEILGCCKLLHEIFFVND